MTNLSTLNGNLEKAVIPTDLVPIINVYMELNKNIDKSFDDYKRYIVEKKQFHPRRRY